MTPRTKTCPHLDKHGRSCPNLQPCETHPPRAKNARWSQDRDPAAHARWAEAVKARDGNRCVRCGSTWKVQAHHVKPGYDVSDGITVCGRCHGALDKNARTT